MNQNELTHYGVKGMKWGVRRNRTSYRQKLEGKIKEQQKATPKKSKKDNATIVLRKEERKVATKSAGKSLGIGAAMFAGIVGSTVLSTPVGAVSAMAVGMGAQIVEGINTMRKLNTIADMNDEYNIDRDARRRINM